MPAMHLNYHRDFGFADETMVAFYTERAKGRAGLISIGGFAVERAGAAVFGGILWGLWNDEYIPALKNLTRSMKSAHPAGKIACQLYHTGRVSSSAVTGCQPVGASDIQSRFNREPVHPLTEVEVADLERKYVDAAVRGIEAGFDCIDIFCGVGHLLNQFLSPETNNRTDSYGGCVENRARIVTNIVRMIRERLPSVPVLARLPGHDLMPQGNTHHEMREIARLLAAAGVDAFNVTGGWHEARIPQITGEVPTGAYAWLAQNIRSAVDIPVAASNRINDPLVAERLLREDQADFISMGRPLLADPHLPIKLIEGRIEQITHCIACNICLDTAWYGPARCLVNPAGGRENEFAIVPSEKAKRVVVVGGGPGGMMAAKIAALKNHHVILYEQAESLGGIAAIGDIAPGKLEYRWLYQDLAKQVQSNPNIELRIGTTATAKLIESDSPDAVVVASGGTPLFPDLPGGQSSPVPVCHAHDVLSRNIDGPIGNNVVIVGGGSTACETALYLKEQGSLDAETVKFLLIHEVMDPEELRRAAMVGQPQRQVTIIQRSDNLAKDLNRSVRWTLIKALQNLDIRVLTNCAVSAVNRDSVVVSGGTGKEEIIPCDRIVVATGIQANDMLYRELKNSSPQYALHLIGDAAGPRQAVEALEEATRIAISL